MIGDTLNIILGSLHMGEGPPVLIIHFEMGIYMLVKDPWEEQRTIGWD